MNFRRSVLFLVLVCILSCKKGGDSAMPDPIKPKPGGSFSLSGLKVNGLAKGFSYYDLTGTPRVELSFSAPINTGTVNQGVLLKDNAGTVIPFTATWQKGDSTLVLAPVNPLKPIEQYQLVVSTTLQSKDQRSLQNGLSVKLVTAIDSTDKFPRISDEELLDLVQRQTFKYFWDFGHPTSGLARERSTSGDVVTSGGSGFGAMAIIVGIERKFITRTEGLARLQKVVSFLKDKAARFHGAFPHWLNGNTGAAIPFSPRDDGADLVETSFLMQGLLTARQYFNTSDAEEIRLRADIDALWQGVEWNWFRKNNEEVLYWHWSPNYGFEVNMPIRGWNEALVTYVLAASSPSHGIPRSVYDNGWANNSSFKNGNTYYGIQLPLGPAFGGPLFFSHYSFLGIDPRGLSDAYANYEIQNRSHALINFSHAKYNPGNFYGYSSENWGLTASDDIAGYLAHEPPNDNGVIAPTAALASFPYTPEQSMAALKFFYYKLGDKIWKEYGFVDAFSLHHTWFADSFLAIDQGPIIVMIENYRTGLLWDLFMSAPEVKAGMKKLGFQSPKL